MEVLVQLVMAAINTSPLPMLSLLPLLGAGGAASAVTTAGLLASISATKRGAPGGVGWGLPGATVSTSSPVCGW